MVIFSEAIEDVTWRTVTDSIGCKRNHTVSTVYVVTINGNDETWGLQHSVTFTPALREEGNRIDTTIREVTPLSRTVVLAVGVDSPNLTKHQLTENTQQDIQV